jgi:hypothetical protein
MQISFLVVSYDLVVSPILLPLTFQQLGEVADLEALTINVALMFI